jgi:hypothetical protein
MLGKIKLALIATNSIAEIAFQFDVLNVINSFLKEILCHPGENP